MKELTKNKSSKLGLSISNLQNQIAACQLWHTSFTHRSNLKLFNLLITLIFTPCHHYINGPSNRYGTSRSCFPKNPRDSKVNDRRRRRYSFHSFHSFYSPSVFRESSAKVVPQEYLGRFLLPVTQRWLVIRFYRSSGGSELLRLRGSWARRNFQIPYSPPLRGPSSAPLTAPSQ